MNTCILVFFEYVFIKESLLVSVTYMSDLYIGLCFCINFAYFTFFYTTGHCDEHRIVEILVRAVLMLNRMVSVERERKNGYKCNLFKTNYGFKGAGRLVQMSQN